MGVERTPKGKWKAKLCIDGERLHIGVFGSEASARAALAVEQDRVRNGTSVFCEFRQTISVAAFAAELSVPLGTMRRWAHEGMPTIRFGTAVRVERELAQAWVTANRARSVSYCRQSLVYFVQRSSDDAIKIGWTSDLERRVRELKRDEYCQCIILAAVPGNKSDELRLHKEFARLALGDEWFESSYALIEHINRLGRAA